MPYTGADDMSDAARRHAADARRLLDAARPDNAIHLAGFAAECALKHAMHEALGAAYDPRDHGHQIERLAGRGLAWMIAVAAPLRVARATAGIRNSPLIHCHPDRRYWASGWPETESRGAVEAAEELVKDLVLASVLDRGLPLGAP